MVSVQIPFTQVKDEYMKVEVECGLSQLKLKWQA